MSFTVSIHTALKMKNWEVSLHNRWRKHHTGVPHCFHVVVISSFLRPQDSRSDTYRSNGKINWLLITCAGFLELMIVSKCTRCVCCQHGYLLLQVQWDHISAWGAHRVKIKALGPHGLLMTLSHDLRRPEAAGRNTCWTQLDWSPVVF